MSKKDFYAYSTLGVSAASICGIIFATTLPTILGCTAIGAAYGAYSLNQLKKINSDENK